MIYKRSHFAKLCGLTTGNLSNYINRGLVLVKEDQTIDTDEFLNEDFLKSRQEKLKEKYKESGETPPEILEKPKKSTKKKAKKKKSETWEIENIQSPEPKQDNSTEAYESLDRRLKKQELLKKEAETRLLNMKEEKLKGEHIPTELVRSIILQQSQSFITAFKNSIEDFITLSAKKSNMNVNEIAEARGKITKMINESANKAIVIAKKGVANIVNEYSVKREVGEHD